MKKVYIWAAHTSFSPGGICRGRREHDDVLKFARFTAAALERGGEISVKILKGNVTACPEKDATVIIFHRDYNEGNDRSYGAKVFVPRDASCDTQYEASRLLESICRFSGFRYKGVHMGNTHTGFCTLENTGCEKTFLFTLGYIDSERDNRLFDENMWRLSDSLSEEITDILKERENETNTEI